MHIDSKDVRIITSLHWNQSAEIKVGNRHGGRINIRRAYDRDMSFRHYCLIYTLNQSLEKHWEGIKVNGEAINNIRYADDTVIIANDCNEL